MDNSKVPSFGRSDKQIADAFGMSVSDFKKVKKQIVSDMTNPKAPTRAVNRTDKKLSDFMKPKATAKATAKAKPVSPKTKPPMPKSKGPAALTGEAAAKAMQKRTSPKGVKEFEKGASKALDKKYPGLYKKSK